MREFNVISWNVNGLNSPIKRSKCLDYLHRKRADIALIQESHLKASDVTHFQNRHFKVIAFSSYNSASRGVIILQNRKFPFLIEKTGEDENGLFTYASPSWNNLKMVLFSVYSPNNNDVDFNFVVNFVDYNLVVEIDANAVCNPLIDRSLVSVHGDQASQSLNELIADNDFCDIWKVKNGSCRDYTFYSARHNSFSRLDYIFISKSLTQGVNHIDILPILISDHSAVICNLSPPIIPPSSKRWRMNTTFLQNEDFVKQLRSKLSLFQRNLELIY